MRAFSITAVAAALLVIAVPTQADDAAIEYRQHVLSSMGGHMQGLVKLLRQQVPHQSHMPVHVNGIATISQVVGDIFEAQAPGGDALDGIWENPDDFGSKVSALQEAAANLKAAMDSGDMGAFGGAVQGVGQACKGCHDNYRAE